MGKKRFHFDIRQSGRMIMAIMLLILMVNILTAAFVVRPSMRAYDTLEEQNRDRLKTLDNRKAEVEGKEAFITAVDKAEGDLSTLWDEILSTKQRRLVPVQLELAKLARQFQINLERVQYDHDYLEDEDLDRLVMVVPLEGGYTNLRHFIQAVEQSESFLVIERVAMDRAKHGGVMLQLNITLATYFDAPDELKEKKGGGNA